jgi:hypothetical protein
MHLHHSDQFVTILFSRNTIDLKCCYVLAIFEPRPEHGNYLAHCMVQVVVACLGRRESLQNFRWKD